MKVEVLSVPDCPTHAAAVKLVTDILISERVAARVHEIVVADAKTAAALRFLGSPTIRINGSDVAGEPPRDATFGLACRLYADSEHAGLPHAELVRRAVRRAREECGS